MRPYAGFSARRRSGICDIDRSRSIASEWLPSSWQKACRLPASMTSLQRSAWHGPDAACASQPHRVIAAIIGHSVANAEAILRSATRWHFLARRSAHAEARSTLKIKYQRPFRIRFTDNRRLFNSAAWNGGRTRTRTLDPLIKSQLLYQLSYAPCTGEPCRPSG